MGLRSAPGTILRFVAAVTGLYFVVGLGLLLVVLVSRALGGHYPIPDESAEPLADFALLVATLLGSWFLVEGYSLKRLLAFAVTTCALLFLPLLGVVAVDRIVGPISVRWTGVGVLLLAVGVFAYLGAYRLVYPKSFAERKRQFGFDT